MNFKFKRQSREKFIEARLNRTRLLQFMREFCDSYDKGIEGDFAKALKDWWDEQHEDDESYNQNN